MPSSGSAAFLITGFALTWGGVAIYAWRLESRLEDARVRLERRQGGDSGSRPPRGGGPTGAPATPEETT